MDGLTVDINKAYVLFWEARLFSLLPPGDGVGSLQDWCIPGHRMDDTEMLEKLW